jgi:hypothetical protein
MNGGNAIKLDLELYALSVHARPVSDFISFTSTFGGFLPCDWRLSFENYPIILLPYYPSLLSIFFLRSSFNLRCVREISIFKNSFAITHSQL